jgi:hypothetical protein
MVSLSIYLSRPMGQVNTEGVSGWTSQFNFVKMYMSAILYVGYLCILNFGAIVSCVRIQQWSV